LGPPSSYAGLALDQLDFQNLYGFAVMGMSRHGHTIRWRPMMTRLADGDMLLLIGQKDDLSRLHRNPNLIVLAEEAFPAVGKRNPVSISRT
jgi:Trk K+ transport system NAD-binding subunit